MHGSCSGSDGSAEEGRDGPDEGAGGVVADVVCYAGGAEGLPVGSVLFVEVWVVLGVVVQVVAHAGTDLCGVCFFQGDAEMVWHLVLSRRHCHWLVIVLLLLPPIAHLSLNPGLGTFRSKLNPGALTARLHTMSYVDQSPSSAMGRRLTNRNNNRYSVTALFSMAAEQDVEVEDDLARGPC